MKNCKKIISTILAVIMILGTLVFVACGPAKKNLLKTMAPDDLLKYVYVTDAEEFAGKFTSLYDAYLSNYNAALSTKGSMSYEPSPELISYIEDDMMGGFKLGLNKLGADIELVKKSPTDMAYLLDLTVNGTSVADLDMFITDGGLVMASEVLFGGAYKDESYTNTTDISSLPAPEIIKTLLPKIVEIALTEVKGVTVTEGQAVNFGDVSESAVALEADITDATLTKIADAVLAELRDNQDIKKILIDFYNTNGQTSSLDYEYDTADEFYAAYTEAITDALEAVKEDAPAEGEEKVICTFCTWIDEDYHIIAVDLKDEDNELLIGATENDDDKGYILDVKYEGSSVLSFVGSIIKEDNTASVNFTLNSTSTGLTIDEKGELVEETNKNSISLKGSSSTEKNIMGGSYTLSVDGKDYIKAELSDVDAKVYKKDHRFVGTVKISTLPGLNDMLSEMGVEPIICTVTAENTKDAKKANIILDLTHGDMSLGKFYITSELSTDTPEFTVPEASDEMPESDPTALLDNLKKAGINETLISLLEMSMSDDYYGDDYYYSEDYEDIFSNM